MDKRSEDSEQLTDFEKEMLKKRFDEKEELRDASGVASDKGKGGGGALNKIITISEDGRQILAGGNHQDIEEADLITAALAEARRYGCDDGIIFDYVSAHCGVSSQSKSKTEWGVHALTRLDINQPGQQKWWRGQKKEEKPE